MKCINTVNPSINTPSSLLFNASFSLTPSPKKGCLLEIFSTEKETRNKQESQNCPFACLAARPIRLKFFVGSVAVKFCGNY